MAKYRLTKGSHSGLVGGKRVEYRAGVAGQDVMELTDAQAALPHLCKRIEKFYGEEAGVSTGNRESPNRPSAQSAPLDFKPDEDESDSEGSLDPKTATVLSGNVPEVLAYIDDNAEDDDLLTALRKAEAADKKRKTVIDKLDELLGD